MAHQLEIRPLEGPCADIVTRHFLSDARQGYLWVQGCFMPQHFPQVAPEILDFEVRDDDVWVCSFPKTGTTWTQEMVWCIANDLDYEGAKDGLSTRFPFLDLPGLFLVTEEFLEMDFPRSFKDPIGYLRETRSRRFIKTHLPFNLLPMQLQRRETKAKIITVSRNPKDVCVSYFHHCVSGEGYTGNFEDFTKMFLGDTVCYAPFNNNVLSYWAKRDDPYILHLKYEDMKKNLPAVIRKTARFLDKEYSEEQVAKLADHLSFENMKRNPAVTEAALLEKLEIKDEGLIRKGKVGGWREAMSAETVAIFDSWIQEHFAGTGLSWQDTLT